MSRLATWLNEERGDIEIQKSISLAAMDWLRRGKRANDLYRGSRLQEAQDWAKRHLPSMDEQMFLEESAHEEIRRGKEEQRIARQVNSFRRATRVLALFVILALSAAMIATIQAGTAQQAQIAVATDVQTRKNEPSCSSLLSRP